MLTATDRELSFGLHSLYRATTEMQFLLRHGDTSCLGWIGWIGVCELPPISGSYLLTWSANLCCLPSGSSTTN